MENVSRQSKIELDENKKTNKKTNEAKIKVATMRLLFYSVQFD
jgi:hypothetical protein